MYVQMTGYSFFQHHQDPRLEVCTTGDQLQKVENLLTQSPLFAYDFETDGTAWWRGDSPCGVAFAARPTPDSEIQSFYIPYRHRTGQTQVDAQHAIDLTKKFVGDSNKWKVLHNRKFDDHMGRRDGIQISGPCVDTMIEARLYNEDIGAKLKERAVIDLHDTDAQVHEHMLNLDLTRLCTAQGMNKTDYLRQFGYSAFDIYLCGKYAAHDAMLTLRLREFYEAKGVRDYYSNSPRGPQFWGVWNIEMTLVEVLTDMEQTGVPVDVDYIMKMYAHLEMEKGRAEASFFQESGLEYFKLGSDDELRDRLISMGCKLEKTTQKGNLAVDADVIKDCMGVQPALKWVLRWKDLQKISSTYTQSLLEYVDEHGILHSDFQQVGTRTGRLSCRNPNLQNIPTWDEKGLTKFLKEVLGYADSDVQKCLSLESVKRIFGVQRRKEDPFYHEKMVRLYVDYSQVELRVLAHYTQDPRLLKTYQEGGDIHNEVELAVFGTGKYIDPQTGEEKNGPNRRKAKCFHPDTEVLTRSGWKRILDLEAGEEVVQAVPSDGFQVQLEWAVPTEVFSKPNHANVLVHLQNEGIDVRVTPDHRMAVWGSPNGKLEPFRVVSPYEVPRVRGWMNSGVMGTGTWSPDETLLRLAVAVQADGTLRPSDAVTFGFTKGRKKERLRQLLEGRPYTETTKGRVTTFYVPNMGDVRGLLTANKEFPWEWLDLTLEARGVVLDEVAHWDSCTRPNWRMVRYSSASSQSLDVVQALAAITNRKTRKALVTGKDSFWNLTIRDKPGSRGGNVVLNEVPYIGEVSCLSVPSTFVLVRDGKAKVPVVTGQTINFGLSYCMSPMGFQRQIREVTEEEAQMYFDQYNQNFPRVPAFRESFWSYVLSNGCVFNNMFGRSAHMPGMTSPDRRTREGTKRRAIATLIQGTAAEFTKFSLVFIHMWMKQQGMASRLTGTVHDEIAADGPVQEFAELTRGMCSIMENFPDMSVPITVDAEYSVTNWSEKHPVPGLKGAA